MIRTDIFNVPQCSSTNDEVLAYLNGPGPVWLWTLQQCSPRGSRGRSWLSPRGSGLAVSSCFTSPPFPSPRSLCYPFFAGVVLYDALKAIDEHLNLRLKWPNDVLLGGRKLAGILCESRWLGDSARIVIGYGINLTDDPSFGQLTDGYSVLDRHLDHIDPAALVASLADHLRSGLNRSAGAQAMVQAWIERSRLEPGQQVTAIWRGRPRTVLIRDIRRDGGLCIQDECGVEHIIHQVHEEFSLVHRE